ncbi:MAG TPA: SUKH-3 domain-containing protein [Actinocrinis sp.]|nr:SUKH-3 domain-containing protein [Actinocrinis sp.]
MSTTSTERFPPLAAAVLRAAGWHEDRDIGLVADAMVERVIERGRAEGFELSASPAVCAALHEFGGLSVTHANTGIDFPGSGFTVDPLLVAHKFEVYAELDRIIGGGSFPFGPEFDGHGSLALGPDGRLFLIHDAGFCAVGDTVDAGLAAWIERAGPPTDIFEVFDDPDAAR